MNAVQMNCVHLNHVDVIAHDDTPPPPLPPDTVANIAQWVLAKLGKTNWEMAIVFTDDDQIQSLNKKWRAKDEPTDILSFCGGDTYKTDDGYTYYNAGDIVISIPTLAANAAYFKVDEKTELCRLIIHGILHLDGRDHETNDAAEPMLIEQESVLSELLAELLAK